VLLPRQHLLQENGSPKTARSHANKG
jgi:hypothetical protein